MFVFEVFLHLTKLRFDFFFFFFGCAGSSLWHAGSLVVVCGLSCTQHVGS